MREALVHLELASEYAGGADLDQLVIDAFCMRLSAGIEVLARLDQDVRARLFGDSWPVHVGNAQSHREGQILGPCGRCREFISQLSDDNLNTEVLVEDNTHVPLRELMPYRWPRD